MPVTSGFFNSISGDRRYDALQMSSLFDGIILDGVFQTVGTAFGVSPGSGNQVIVGVGRAWFKNTWTLNDSALPLTLPASHSSLSRIDAVVIEVDVREEVRANTIKVVSGAPSSNPARPSLLSGSTRQQYAIAYITRPPGASTVSGSQIAYTVGTGDTPFVTAPLETISAENWTASMQDKFETWFFALGDLLDSNAEASMANAILQLQQDLSEANDDVSALSSKTTSMDTRLTSIVENVNRNDQNSRNRDSSMDTRIKSLESGDAPLATRMSTFRGRNITEAWRSGSGKAMVSISQLNSIWNGTFNNMWLGDYWDAGGGRTYRIVDFNYYHGLGGGLNYNVAGRPHVVVMPDFRLASVQAFLGNTNGGYNGSRLQVGTVQYGTAVSPSPMLDRIQSDLFLTQAHTPLFGEYVTNTMSSGSHAMILSNQRIIVPTMQQIFGNTTNDDDLFGLGTTQFALFRERRAHIRMSGGYQWHLRTIRNTSNTMTVNSNGMAVAANISTSPAIRPYFLIVGQSGGSNSGVGTTIPRP